MLACVLSLRDEARLRSPCPRVRCLWDTACLLLINSPVELLKCEEERLPHKKSGTATKKSRSAISYAKVSALLCKERCVKAVEGSIPGERLLLEGRTLDAASGGVLQLIAKGVRSSNCVGSSRIRSSARCGGDEWV